MSDMGYIEFEPANSRGFFGTQVRVFDQRRSSGSITVNQQALEVYNDLGMLDPLTIGKSLSVADPQLQNLSDDGLTQFAQFLIDNPGTEVVYGTTSGSMVTNVAKMSAKAFYSPVTATKNVLFGTDDPLLRLENNMVFQTKGENSKTLIVDKDGNVLADSASPFVATPGLNIRNKRKAMQLEARGSTRDVYRKQVQDRLRKMVGMD